LQNFDVAAIGELTKLNRVNLLNSNLTALDLAVIIKKAPQLQNDIFKLFECLEMFKEYHQATGFIFNVIFMKMENILNQLHIVNRVCKSKCLFVNKRKLFNNLSDYDIKGILDNPEEYPGIIDVINTVMARDLLFVRGWSNIKDVFVGPQAQSIVSFLYKDIIKPDNHQEEKNLYKDFIQQAQVKHNKGPVL
jgi:hypothetical protein